MVAGKRFSALVAGVVALGIVAAADSGSIRTALPLG